MALFTANPVTLNREQILRADYVVTGTMAENDKNAIVVEKEWKHGKPLDIITVENLNETAARPNQKYLIPVSKTKNNRFLVTPNPLPNQAPLIYPATPEAVSELNAVLNQP